eukprot:CAMPEP_0172395408 /NCGR_PEP_ID=MMETSP1061-20121228/19482_1 /TAXON_ID=37318 /ORGANISM="Pseudo-nitzschia pungens, Strain cf. pungens" /LENGTH=430 /DNA_ID=CAMNT_0013126977 /DNA_START=13 /DNA_END=1306 /DNA_ORIENTATION=+
MAASLLLSALLFHQLAPTPVGVYAFSSATHPLPHSLPNPHPHSLPHPHPHPQPPSTPTFRSGKSHDSFRLFDAVPSLYQEQERLLVERGRVESELMKDTGSPIAASVSKGTGTAKGFAASSSSSSSSSSSNLKAAAKIHSKELRKSGVVRIDDVLTGDMAEQMRNYVFELRERAEEQVGSGQVRSIARFADVLLKENRCDLTIPLEDDDNDDDVVVDALLHVLQKTPVGKMMSSMLGKQAGLYELSCLISDKGSNRQVVHPDTPCKPDEDAVLYTCFIALQDIDPTMGPTTWLPNTHTMEAHEIFKDDYVGSSYSSSSSSSTAAGESSKDKLLRTTPSVLGLLPRGSCAIFDSRLLHCGGANTSDTSRALFYFSFKNSGIGYPGNPGSIRPELASKFTITSLEQELKQLKKKKGDDTDDGEHGDGDDEYE